MIEQSSMTQLFCHEYCLLPTETVRNVTSTNDRIIWQRPLTRSLTCVLRASSVDQVSLIFVTGTGQDIVVVADTTGRMATITCLTIVSAIATQQQ